jgi:alkyl hydroperoxide reductase subunit AhpC
VVGLSVGELKEHNEWIKAIYEHVLKKSHTIDFPIIADQNGHAALDYDM